MKKTEIILGAMAAVALITNLLFAPTGNILIVLSLSVLSILYMYLSFALFNGIRFRHILKKESYKGISTMRIIGAIFTGLALSITLIGILFKYQLWPGATINLRVGLSGLVLMVLIGAVGYARSKAAYYANIAKRIAIYGALGIIMLLLPTDELIEIRYRNHPEYAEALKKAIAAPGNEDLWQKAEAERQRMNTEN
ncbi:hypothetical protein H7F15_04960 [Pontibacter sp. Tf4]|uniref:hypothetical protein n=1 Tax=Pontibacter sp. Tf4 TaxID=2761620 RepID=UPI0016251276|nr:hypothetical protein [Pontibacter sp. Tf4]MBB6610380.1 hypothetical protein [Pontibacter sp. Tf4]